MSVIRRISTEEDGKEDGPTRKDRPRCFSEVWVAYQFRVFSRGDRDGGFGRDGLLWRGEANPLEVDTSWARHSEGMKSLELGLSVWRAYK